MTQQARHLFPGQNVGGPAIQTRGQMGCFVIERREVPQMMFAADHGDFTAAQVRIGIGLWMQQAFLPQAPRQRCVSCGHTWEHAAEPEAFFLAIPYKGDGDSLVSGMCKRCVRRVGSEGLLAACAEHFKRIFPKGVITGDIAGAAKP
jgi:hypothetical protein